MSGGVPDSFEEIHPQGSLIASRTILIISLTFYRRYSILIKNFKFLLEFYGVCRHLSHSEKVIKFRPERKNIKIYSDKKPYL